MNNALPVKKIFVDSRYRTSDSTSDSDFKIQLGRNIFLPDDTMMHIESCVIPHTWYTIEQGINDGMYLKVVTNSTTTYTIIIIPSNNYTGSTLATAVQTALTSAYPTLFSVSYNTNKNHMTISIASGSYFKILTDNELSTYLLNTWGGLNYDRTNPAACNDIITNRTVKLNDSTSPFVSGSLNLQGFRSVYLSSSNLSNFNTLGAKGENSIIKKIVTSSDFGYLIVSELGSDHDYLDCSRMTLNTIDFQITDVKGNLIPFHDSPVSFTIVFSQKR
jgi:uncharacterized protein Veg